MNKIAKELVKIAKSLIAIEFPTQKAMDKYLKEHPDADKRLHWVSDELHTMDRVNGGTFPKKDNEELERKIKENPEKSEELYKEHVKKRPLYIQKIKNPSENVQIEAVKSDPRAIRFINNPTESAQIEAVKRNHEVFRNIRKPTDKVRKFYHERLKDTFF